MASPPPRGDDRTSLLHDVLEVALAVARRGEPTDAPAPLRPYLRMRHRVPRALAAADRAGDDAGFRARVAEVVGEDERSPAEALWLARPEGWEDDLEALVAEHRAAREEDDARRLLERERRARAAAEADRDRADARAAEAEAERDRLRTEADEARRATDDAAAAGAQARRERATAVASLKDLEAAHARVHEELRAVQGELRAVQGDLRAERDRLRAGRDADAGADGVAPDPAAPDGGPGPGAGPAPAVGPTRAATGAAEARDPEPGPAPAAATHAPGVDPAVADGVASAAQAAGELAAALVEVAARLRAAPPDEGPDVRPSGESGAGAGERRRPAPSPTRRPAPLPGGLHDDSVEAAEHLVRLPRAALLVDGYNASMATWPDLDLVAQRRRLVAALAELEARCGPEVVVVFDGVDDGTARPAGPTRRVRIEFTPGAVEADDVLIERVASLPAGRPVVVVSDDHRVRHGARAAGANLVGTAQLQALIGRGRR